MSLESILERVAISAERSELLLSKILAALDPVVTTAAAVPMPTPAAPAAGGAPFTDQAGLMTYVMEKYKALGPIKGAMIQSKLLELGCANIKALPVEKYGTFHAAVEAL
jgi:hypothetical protein